MTIVNGTLEHPNLLIIMSDDQGPWAMGCAGTQELKTPNIDRIAAEGLRFENFFCASPVCSPARASFLTGRIPSQHGVHDWIKHGNMKDPEGRTWHGPEESFEYLDGLTAFTDVLAANGYSCGISGKWHLGASDIPQKSHDFWCVHALGGDSYTDYWVFDNDSNMTHQTQYVTDFFTDRALDYLDSRAETQHPFCLSVHYTAPHSPWRKEEQPTDIWNSYERTEFSLPIEMAHPWQGWDPTLEERHSTIQGYYTTITAMDRAIGRLLKYLDQTGLSENTLVLFTSDNGYSMGHHGIMGKGNGTFPLNMFEESVKVPFLIRLPGQSSKGVVFNDLLSHYDVMPTLLDLFDMEAPSSENLPGRSFAPLLRGQSLERVDEAIVICDEYGPNRMLRTPEWKYIHRYPEGPNELYNLVQDAEERENLFDQTEFYDIRQKLSIELDQWFNRYIINELDGSKLNDCRGGGQRGCIKGNSDHKDMFHPL